MPRAPRLTFRGINRGRLNKLRNAIEMMLGMDSREQTQAAKQDRDPVLFVSTASLQTALQKISDRVDQCLAQKG